MLLDLSRMSSATTSLLRLVARRSEHLCHNQIKLGTETLLTRYSATRSVSDRQFVQSELATRRSELLALHNYLASLRATELDLIGAQARLFLSENSIN